jgi:hypothetical protein
MVFYQSGTNKMYQDLKKNLWWMRMKREIVKYVSDENEARDCEVCVRM